MSSLVAIQASRNLLPRKASNLAEREPAMRSAPAPNIASPSGEVEHIRRTLGRDDTAFRTIMERHNRRLYRIARGILRNDSEAEDAVQEAYVKANPSWRFPRRFKSGDMAFQNHHERGFGAVAAPTSGCGPRKFRSAAERGRDHQIPSNPDNRSGTDYGATGNSAAQWGRFRQGICCYMSGGLRSAGISFAVPI
jgi:Sigma-70 region 2